MKKSVKAALLSGLVFPGAGQLWLKRYVRGVVLIGGVLASLAVIVTQAAQQAYAILEKAETEGGTVDLAALITSANHLSATAGDFTAKAASALLVVCWIAATVDAYLVGKREDVAGPPEEPAKQPDGISKK